MNLIINTYNLRRITPHGFRHTHATILIPLTTIADRLGNTPIVLTTTYAHAFKELEQESVTAFIQARNS